MPQGGKLFEYLDHVRVLAEASADREDALRRKQPGLAMALEMVEAAESPTAAHTAQLLYGLGSAIYREGKARRLDSREQTQVASAVAKLTDLMLAGKPGSPGSKHIVQQSGKGLSLSAWALSKAKPFRGVQVSRLGLALADVAWRSHGCGGLAQLVRATVRLGQCWDQLRGQQAGRAAVCQGCHTVLALQGSSRWQSAKCVQHLSCHCHC